MCTKLEGELTAHVETANRDDSKDLMVYVTTDSNRSGFCSFHVSRYDGRWWLSKWARRSKRGGSTPLSSEGRVPW